MKRKITKPYLICSDLDSTLLIRHERISRRTIRLIRKLVKQNHIFVMSTGRPLQATLPFYRLLKIKCPIVCNNGSSIYIPNSVFRKKNYTLDFISKNSEEIHFQIPSSTLKEILSKLKPYLECLYGYTNNEIITINFEKTPFWMHHPDKSLEVLDISDINLLNEDVNIVSLFTNNYDVTKEVLDSYNISYEYWGDNDKYHAFELQLKDISKGYALKYLCSKYNIDIENTISFGDSLNDIDMLVKSHIGVGMINAKKEVLEKVKYKTEFDSEHDGVRIFLENFFK